MCDVLGLKDLEKYKESEEAKVVALSRGQASLWTNGLFFYHDSDE